MSLEQPFYLVADVAERWHCRPAHVQDLIRKGALRGVKLGGRWQTTLADLEAFEAGQESRPVARRRRRRAS